MAIRKYKPTTPGRRGASVADFAEVTRDHPEKSLVYLRVARRGQGQMPPLATSEIDRDAVQLLHDWIKQME